MVPAAQANQQVHDFHTMSAKETGPIKAKVICKGILLEINE